MLSVKYFFKKNINNRNYKLKSKKDLTKNEEYIQNQMQINCIKKVLVEHAEVPETLINWLIESVQKITELKYEKL